MPTTQYRASAPTHQTIETVQANQPKQKARDGKKAVIAYFTPRVSDALRKLAIDHSTTLQAVIGEAIDLLMVKNGMSPFGER
jgi:hypothetical protein